MQSQVNNFESRGWIDEGLSGMTKLSHYLKLVLSSLIAPLSGANESGTAWNMAPPTDTVDIFFIAGAVLLLLAVLGFVLNYRHKIAQIAFVGVLVSFFFVFIKALNINENAVVLNTLFFAWAFVTLLIMAIEKIFKKITLLRDGVLLTIVTACLIYNSVAAYQLFKFGIEVYPIA